VTSSSKKKIYLNDRFHIYNKEMSSIDWDDVNVLRNLPDGWYSVPSDSKYGEMITKDSNIKYNDSVKKAKERHDVVLRKEREIDDFIKTEKLRDKPCDHKNYSYKGYLICAECGLMEKNFDPYAFNEGDENRVHITNEEDENDVIVRLCFKAMTVIKKFIDDLDGAGGDIPTFDVLDVFETYVLTSDDRGRRRFRISARLEGLCAALLWRNLQIRKKPMTMLEFSKKIKMDRMTVSQIVKRLDDYENFKLNKRGRPKRK
jgi:hypothetical protein